MAEDSLITAFDSGEDMAEHFDFDAAERPNRSKRVNVDFPVRMIEELDAEAECLGINRQAVIKMLCDEALTHRRAARKAAVA